MIICGFQTICKPDNPHVFLFIAYIQLMNSQKIESTSRIPQLRKLLTEQFIEELLVKFVLSVGDKQQTQYRLVYHFKHAYYYFLEKHKLQSHKSTPLYNEQQNFFMGKLNEYLPDFLRLETYLLQDLRETMRKIPVCGAIISRDTKKEFLLVQDRRTNKYGFCKGKMSEGETPEECVKRQVREETGLQVHSLGQKIEVKVNANEYVFIWSELKQGHHADKQIVYEGSNHHHEIKKLVWWSVAKIKDICRKKNSGPDKFNHPTFTTFRKIFQW